MKNKLILLILSLIAFSYPVLADTDMMGSNMMGFGMMDGTFGGGLFWLIYLAIASFIFALIFWYTYKLVIPQKRR